MGYLTKDGLPIDGLTEAEMTAFLNGKPLVAEKPSERRSSPRHPFHCLRSAADWQEGVAAGAYYQVRCHDLSANGIGFFAPKPPGSHTLIVRLSADGEKPVLIAAKVVYTNDKSGDAAFPYVVGCMFTHRLAAAEI